jgi:type II secretory pathway component GspD/PulD (secretin)
MRFSHATKAAALIVLVALVAGCATGRAFRRGETAARAGDWDTAVEHYRQALIDDPDNAAYRIALERAMLSASIIHLDQARLFEARGQLEDALREYRRASEFDPPNRQVAGKVMELERRLRDQIEAAKPRPSIEQLRQTARQTATPPPLANLNTIVDPIRFNQSSLRDILTTIGQFTGINVTFEGTYTDRTYSVQLESVTLGEALQQILSANQLFYKVINQRTIMVIPDNPQKRAQYEDQVVQTFFISHVDALELAQFLNTIVRLPGAQTVAPTVVGNKTTNTVTARATASVMEIIERLISSNDTPRAEVVIDVQILEVNRNRTKQFGLDLGTYALTAVFSPEVDPRTDDGIRSPSFNANTISRGISTADFYLSVPSAVIRFLESDSNTKVIAKPQLRGAEGVALKLNLGEEIPVPTTTFTPLAQGGANFNPLTSFNYKPVGVRIEMTPRVTYEGEIVLDLYVENSTLGPGIVIADQELPSFGSRNVTTRLRLREGESTLLAGLLREDERRSLSGFPGLLRIPVIRSLFANNDSEITQTDIVMLLTPRIVRTHELSAQDLAPIYIGTQTNLGLSGPPPLIAPADVAPPPDAPLAAPGAPGAAAPAVPTFPGAAPSPGVATTAPPAALGAAGAAPMVPGAPPAAGPAATAGTTPPGVSVVPPGSSAVPGTTTVPSAAVPAQGASGGQILVSPPSADFRVGGGPYTVPISITGASQISGVSITVTYNPAVLRLRATTEGSFMRAGGVPATFTQQPDASAGRIDIAIMRTGDATGVAGTGLLAALLFDAIGAGPANLAVTASANAPGGLPVPLQFAPVPAVTVK